MEIEIQKSSKVYIAGHRGMLGSAIHRAFLSQGFTNVITADKAQLNLLDQNKVNAFFKSEKPEFVILAAAKVGGINANMTYPAQFLYENLEIQNNVIHASFQNEVKKFVFLGSSCIYPKSCPQPMKEEYLLTGPLEPTNEGYALAKISGLKMLEFYNKQYGFESISLMPCNLYGPNDSFDLQHSHVLSALVKRFTDAKINNDDKITLWGTGVARREFMHVDDAAHSVLYMLQHYNSPEFINVGWGDDISIKELAHLIAQKVNFKGQIIWDSSKPDGMLRKCMDVSKMKNVGFNPQITLDKGIDQMIELYNTLSQKL
jgi:GDP-L-fucose synthase